MTLEQIRQKRERLIAGSYRAKSAHKRKRFAELNAQARALTLQELKRDRKRSAA